jgi:hypothetical protein
MPHLASKAIKSVDKAFKRSVFIFEYQDGFETAEFHADIKSDENVEKNVYKKIIPQTTL